MVDENGDTTCTTITCKDVIVGSLLTNGCQLSIYLSSDTVYDFNATAFDSSVVYTAPVIVDNFRFYRSSRTGGVSYTKISNGNTSYPAGSNMNFHYYSEGLKTIEVMRQFSDSTGTLICEDKKFLYVYVIGDFPVYASFVKSIGNLPDSREFTSTSYTNGFDPQLHTIKYGWYVENSFYDTDIVQHQFSSPGIHTIRHIFSIYDKINNNMIASDEVTDTVLILPNSTVGVSDHSREVLSVYPNPASDKVYIEGLKSGGQWKLFTMSGTTVTEGNISLNEETTKLNLPDLPGGIYILKIMHGDKIETVKLRVNR